jgi:hypothetical protein
MLNFRQALLIVDGQQYELKPGKINLFDTFYVDFQYETLGNHEHDWSLYLHPKQDVLIGKIVVELHLPAAAYASINTNGWQSSNPSGSRLLAEKTLPEEGMWKGDQSFRHLTTAGGIFHSWNFSIFQGNASDLLVGSTNETTGFTVFSYDAGQEIMRVQKDLNQGGLSLSHSFPLLSFCSISGKVPGIFDRYCQKMDLHRPNIEKAWLWSTAGCTDLVQVEKGIEQAAAAGLPFTGVLIDDGWATIGDWVAGQKILAAEIALRAKRKGLSPTLSLSPLLAGLTSKTAHQHPDWLVKDLKNQPFKINCPNGEQAYILDIYHPGVRDFLSGFFHIAIEKWGITSFFLSNLFVAAAAAPPEKTRGQAMHDALEWLRQLSGHRIIFGADVPVGSALGQLNILVLPNTTTVAHVQSAIGRQDFRGRAYATAGRNAILQKVKRAEAANMQYTQSILNALFNDILMVQGSLESLDPEIRSELDEIAMWHRADYHKSQWLEIDLLRLDVTLDGEKRVVYTNFSTRKKTFWENQTSIELRPFETLTF